jgi:uncharacterized protein
MSDVKPASNDDETTQACVICGKPQDPALKPFCSKRCQHVDLNRWLKGDVYTVPVIEQDSGVSLEDTPETH